MAEGGGKGTRPGIGTEPTLAPDDARAKATDPRVPAASDPALTGTLLGPGVSDPAIKPTMPPDDEARTKLSEPAIARPAVSDLALKATLVGAGVSDPAMKATMLPESDAAATGRAPLEGRVESLGLVDRAHYDVLGEFGRGGLGRVLRARDRRTGRIVAVKEALRATPGLLARFAREALVTANLQHPSIIPGYEVGRWFTGEPFYAMKLVAGRSLAEAAKQTTTLRERIALLAHMIAVADALAYAHGERVIHRDLKPANVLIGDYGETVVIDWGLAKRLGDADDLESDDGDASDGKTVAGSVMGTPGYMAPEQARGEPVDERADVYAIGAMMYEVLSGKRPFADTTSIDEVLRLAAERRPPPLATLDPEIPAELAAIVARAMAFDRERRYRDARALAEDLKRFQTGQLVGAHEYTPWQLVARWLRRHAAVVTAGAIGVAALAVVGGYSVVRIRSERDRAVDAQRRAVAAQALAEDRAAALAEEQGRQLTVSGDATRGLPYLAAAVEAGRHSPALAFTIARALEPLDHVEAVLAVSAAPLDGVSYSPDKRRVVTSGEDGIVRVWDVHDHRLDRELVATWMPDGPIAVITDPAGHVDLVGADGKRAPLPGALGELPVTLAVARSTVALGGADGGLFWWSGTTARAVPHAHGRKLLSLAISADGTLLASGGDDQVARVWNIADGAAVATFTLDGSVREVAWSPDGKRLACASASRGATIYDVATRAAVKLTGHKDSVESVRFSRDGAHVLTGSRDDTAALWNAATGAQLASLPVGHHVVEAAFSPDDAWIATRDEHGDITLFTGAGALVATLAGHTGSPSEMAFSDDQLASVGLDGDLRLWRLSRDPALTELDTAGSPAWRGEISRDGKLAAAGEDGTLVIWDAAGAKEIATGTARVRGAAWSPDGTRFLLTLDHAGAELYASDGKRLGIANAPVEFVTSVAWLRDGSRFVLGADNSRLVFAFDGTTAASAGTLAGHALAPVFVLEGAPGTDDLLSTSGDGTARIWHGTTSRLAIGGASSMMLAATYRPDGALVATGVSDGVVEIWDAQTGKQVGRQRIGPPVTALRWSPDGERLLVLTNGQPRLWRVAPWHGAVADLAARLRCTLHWRLDGTTLVPAAPDPMACR
jgi:WD40 repeat protein/tRNA A-37 threonylcarbamoyl transferase component Bud32